MKRSIAIAVLFSVSVLLAQKFDKIPEGYRLLESSALLTKLQVGNWPLLENKAGVPVAVTGKIALKIQKNETIEFLDQFSVDISEVYEADQIVLLNISADEDIFGILARLKKQKEVVWAELDLRVPVALHRVDPDDVLYNYQGGVLTHLRNQEWHEDTNETTFNEHHGIPSAWEYTTGSDNIYVAVIDTGVDMQHEDLAGNISAGIDVLNDQGDGSPVLNSDPDSPFMDYHGTAVAGIIGAQGNNKTGSVGVCWDCALISVRLIDSYGTIYDYASRSKIYDAFAKAVESGADVINNSWGPYIRNESDECVAVDFSEFVFSGVEKAVAEGRNGRGSVVVFSSGNESCNTALLPHLNSDSILVVSALDGLGAHAPYSNYGDQVDIAAVEGNWTLDISGKAGLSDGTDQYINKIEGLDASAYIRNFRGTSAAAPVVSGAVALLLDLNPNLSAEEAVECVKKSALQIEESCPHGDWTDKDGKLHSPCFGYGKLQVEKMLQMAMNGDCGGMCSKNEDCVEGTLCDEESGLCYFSSSDDDPDQDSSQDDHDMDESVDEIEGVAADDSEMTDSESVDSDYSISEEGISEDENNSDNTMPQSDVDFEVGEESEDSGGCSCSLLI